MGVLFAALTTLCMLSLISAFYQADKVAVTLTLVNVGDVALFGLVIDRVSTLILLWWCFSVCWSRSTPRVI